MEGKWNGMKSERETNHERLSTPGNKQGSNWVLGIKAGTCWDEHWVLYATNKSLTTTTKTYDVLYPV